MKMRIPRMLHRLYAFIMAYFWEPCPICDKMFGGHEASATGLMTSWHAGEMTCSNCTEEVTERNKEFMVSNPLILNA